MANTKIENGIIYGNHNFMVPSHFNYGAFFLERISKLGNKPAIINGSTDETITYAELSQQIINATGYLMRLGVKRGVVVAICSESKIEVVVTAIATICAGGTVTVVNNSYSKDELIHTMNISRPKYIFLSPDAYKKHFSTLSDLVIVRKFFIYGDKVKSKINLTAYTELISVHNDNFKSVDFYGQQETAFILYSSGTTGLPKGAKITNLNMIISALQTRLSAGDLSIQSIAPWCTCMGLITVMSTITRGMPFIFLTRFEEEPYFKSIEKYKPKILTAVPPMILIFCKSNITEKYDVSSVEFLHSGGSALDGDLASLIKTKFPNLKRVLQGYGMTETSGALTEETEDVYKQGSVGKPAEGIILKVVDLKTDKILGPNSPGEVCVKGPLLFAGYIGKTLEVDSDGFYRTGDIAYYDEEGYFFVVDRLKELIKYKTWQVAPSELEAVLLQHSDVKDVGVIGAPDKMAGELPTAFVVKQPGANVTEKQLIDFVASKVSKWKQLSGGVRFVSEIPKNPSGKILRRKLRELLNKKVPSKL